MNEYYLEGKNRIFYRRNSNPGKKTLVFVHGLSGSSSAWSRYEKYFEKKYNLIVFDLLGHGKSDKPPKYEDYEIKKLAQNLYALLQREKIKKCIVIGHSLGNLIVLEFLKLHSTLVEKLVLLSAAHDPSRRISAKILKPFLRLFSYFDFIPIRKNGSHVDYSRYVMAGDWNIPRMVEDITNTTLRVYLYGTLQAYSVRSYNFLAHIKQPVLIVHGDRDSIFPLSHAQEMSRSIRNSKLVVLKEANHILVLNCFERVSKLIEEFIEEK